MATNGKNIAISRQDPNNLKIVPNEGKSKRTSVGPPEDTPKKSTTRTYESLEDVVRAIYTGQFRRKRLDLGKKELTSIRNSLPLTSTNRDKLLKVAESDQLLDKTYFLMLLGINNTDSGLSAHIHDFCRDVLMKHPLLESKAMKAVLFDLSEAPARDEAIEMIMSSKCASIVWRSNEKSLTTGQCKKCKLNATRCLLLRFWALSDTTLRDILRLLPVAEPSPRNDLEKISILLDCDMLPASVADNLLEKEMNKYIRDAERAEKKEAQISDRLTEIEQQLIKTEQELDKARSEIQKTSRDLETNRQNHATELSHKKDDYEKLKGRMLRRLKEDLSLLDEGVHALQRDPPKVHVMVDHAERTIDNLKREMELLRGGGME
ncbi:MAG: hypothetical protein ACR2PR_00250 [Pseudohongiellaceae bacterium]